MRKCNGACYSLQSFSFQTSSLRLWTRRPLPLHPRQRYTTILSYSWIRYTTKKCDHPTGTIHAFQSFNLSCILILIQKSLCDLYNVRRRRASKTVCYARKRDQVMFFSYAIDFRQTILHRKQDKITMGTPKFQRNFMSHEMNLMKRK